MYNACAKCVCKLCPNLKIKNEWCEPCKLCHNHKVTAKLKCLEEKMLNQQL